MSIDETSHTSPDPSSNASPDSNGELYALGALSPAERQEFEALLASGEISQEATEEHLATMINLAEEIASVMPAPRKAVKDAIMAAIAPAPASAPEQIIVLANQGEWQEMAPGISIKILFHNQEQSRTTLLVRLGPGAAYPPHRHVGTEECLVLEGDLHVDGSVLHTGDFTVSLEDKVHSDTHSEHGCLLLISSPMNDEFLESPGHSDTYH